MDSLLDRLASLEAGRTAAVAGAALVAMLAAGWVVAAVSGRWDWAEVAAVVVAALSAVIGLLYAFELGTPA